MKKQFVEKKMRISVSIVYDPDRYDRLIGEIDEGFLELLETYRILFKNLDIEFEDIKYE